VVQENSQPHQTTSSPIDILIAASRQIARIEKAFTLPRNEFNVKFLELSRTINAIVKFKGRDGGDSEIRKAKEFAKRPNLMKALYFLGRSPLFLKVWTPHVFKQFAEWDLTVRSKSVSFINLNC